MINSLVLCKNELKLESNDAIARLVELLWGSLDFKNVSDQITRGGSAVHERFNFLQRGLVELFQNKVIDKSQVKTILDFTQRTLFAHLNLFLACMSAKQHRRQKPLKIYQSIPQQTPKGGLVSAQCKEIVEVQPVQEDQGIDPMDASMNEGMDQ